jgi:hypothetical protein
MEYGFPVTLDSDLLGIKNGDASVVAELADAHEGS